MLTMHNKWIMVYSYLNNGISFVMKLIKLTIDNDILS